MKKKGFFNDLNHVASSNSKMFEFYYFVRELQEQIVCTTLLTCGILNFLIPVERILCDEKKCFEKKRECFVMYCTEEKN